MSPKNLKKQKLYSPFPIVVFGTLRCIPKNQGNASLMFIKSPIKHKKCFIPHFYPEGIWLNFKKDSCGVAEIFYYKQEDWLEIIKRLDDLESYDPESDHNHSYQRTLMKVHLLPDDYEDEIYNKGLSLNKRSFKIPRENWRFSCDLAWIYSNKNANLECDKNISKNDNPIIFY